MKFFNSYFIFFLIFFYPVSAFSEHEHNTEIEQKFIFEIQVNPDQWVRNGIEPNLARLTIQKSKSDNFKLIKAETMKGKISHFLKVEYSDYSLEVWQGKDRLLIGGFRNPNLVHHELMDENNQWVQKEFFQNQTNFLIRVPLKNTNQPLIVKFYQIKTKI